MATSYLTPGVYVEEVPSANKPIEGVGTSIAAFVGPRSGRAGQPADPDLELDAVRERSSATREPRERPVHGGRLPRALRLRLLPERRRPLLDRARRQRPTAASAHGGAAGRRRRERRGVPRGRARRASTRDVKLELTAEQRPAAAARARRRAARPPTSSRSPRAPRPRSTTASASRRAAPTSSPRSTPPRS